MKTNHYQLLTLVLCLAFSACKSSSQDSSYPTVDDYEGEVPSIEGPSDAMTFLSGTWRIFVDLSQDPEVAALSERDQQTLMEELASDLYTYSFSPGRWVESDQSSGYSPEAVHSLEILEVDQGRIVIAGADESGETREVTFEIVHSNLMRFSYDGTAYLGRMAED